MEIEKECSIDLEISKKIKKHDGKPVFFPKVKDHSIPIVSGLYGFRSAFTLAVNTPSRSFSGDSLASITGMKPIPASNPASFISHLCDALDNTVEPEISSDNGKAPCQEVMEKPRYLQEIPVLKHLSLDGGRYITSGIAVYNCPRYGRNISYHRMMVIGEDKLVARVVENRGLDTAMNEMGGKPVEAAIIIGNSPQVMVAGSTSPEKGVDELSIANALHPISLVKCKSIDVHVPTDSEIIIEGRFIQEKADEGPFLDLTGTLDIIRKQPIFEVSCITHRKDPIYHALLPASREHEFLMGLPREATMLKELRKLKYVKDVRLTPGSSHWFNAVVQVDAGENYDPVNTFKSCFKGHGSLKNCIVVDEDIDIDDPMDLEFAITTRCQFDKDLHLFKGERGSSLDPSANQVTRETCKTGIDATIPRGKDPENFRKIAYDDDTECS